MSASRNIGMSAASQGYIKFLDADDIMPHDALQNAMEVATLDNRKVIVGKTNRINSSGDFLGVDGYNLRYDPSHLDIVRKEYLLCQPITSMLWLIPNSVVNSGLYFDEDAKLGEEYGFSRRLIASGAEFVYADRIFSSIREHNGNRLSRSGTEADYLAQRREISRNADYIINNIPEADERSLEIIAETCWSLGRHSARIGFIHSAEEHFLYARSLKGKKAIVGRPLYRAANRLLGPVRAEQWIDGIKSIFRRVRRG